MFNIRLLRSEDIVNIRYRDKDQVFFLFGQGKGFINDLIRDDPRRCIVCTYEDQIIFFILTQKVFGIGEFVTFLSDERIDEVAHNNKRESIKLLTSLNVMRFLHEAFGEVLYCTVDEKNSRNMSFAYRNGFKPVGNISLFAGFCIDDQEMCVMRSEMFA